MFVCAYGEIEVDDGGEKGYDGWRREGDSGLGSEIRKGGGERG